MLKAIGKDYYLEVKKLISWAILLFIFSSMVIIYIKTSSYSRSLINIVNKDLSLIENDFNKLYVNYSKQLIFVRNNVNKIGFDSKKLETFFQSTETLILDRSCIAIIIVTDKEFNIVYSHQVNIKDNQNNIQNNQIANRLYTNQLKKFPNEVTVGEIVKGAITGNLSIPLALAIQDNSGNFKGSVIFSVALEGINKELTKTSLDKILLADQDLSNRDLYNSLLNNPSRFFLAEILNNKNDYITFSKFNEQSNKYLLLDYNTTKLRQAFLQDIGIYILILFLLIFTICGVIYYYVLLPLKRSLDTINQLILNGNDNIIFDNETNLFNKIATIITLLSKQLDKQNLLYLNQENRLMQTMYLYMHIINYINDKTEGFNEDVDDAVSIYGIESINKDFFTAIRRYAIENEEEIKSVTTASTEALNIIYNSTQTLCNIQDLLIQNGVHASLIKFAGQPFHSSNNASLQVNLYQNLISELIKEVLSYETDLIRLHQVQIDQDKSFSFIFNFLSNEICSPPTILTRCKIWAAFNNIKINLIITINTMTIFCSLQNNLESNE